MKLSVVCFSLSPQQMAGLLVQMCLETEVIENGEKLKVLIPPTRRDIIHAADIIEDVAIAFGYNNIVKRYCK